MDSVQKAIAGVVLLLTCWYPIFLRYLDSWRRRRTNAVLAPARMEDYFTRRQLPEDKTFVRFGELGEDIAQHVLSFVADAPFEGQSQNFMSSLTHSLPMVSKQFRRWVCDNEVYWSAALIRQVTREPGLWRVGLIELLPDDLKPRDDDREPETASQLLDRFGETIPSRELYGTVLNTQIRQQKPIFAMRQQLKLGEPYGLHFFEPRYRLLVAEVLRDFPDDAKRGEPICCAPGQKKPTFIHAHIHPLEQGTPACLVEIVRCRIYPSDGRADVFLLPVAHVRMERYWERPNSGHLFYARCIQVGREESERLDRVAAHPQIFAH